MNRAVSYQKVFQLTLFIKFVVCSAILLFIAYPLAPDEAQYWTWSRSFSFGYYSKPPGIAWQIYLGTQIFGDYELGVRFFSLIWALLHSIALWKLCKSCELSEKSTFWPCILLTLSPIGFMGSLAATTDGGYLFFWILSAAQIAKGLQKNRRLNSTKIGMYIALGALFKWAIFWMLIPLLIISLLKKHYSLKEFVKTLSISFLGLLPSLYWNVTNDFATFKHVFGNMAGAPKQSNAIEFFFGQFLLLSPITYIFLLMGLIRSCSSYRLLSSSLKFCLVMTLSIFVVFHGASFFQKMQLNWMIHIYPTWLVLLGWALSRWQCHKRALIGSNVVSIVLLGIVITTPLMQKLDLFPVPYSLNLFKHSMGWNKLEKILIDEGYNPENHFLFSSTYQNTSILSFYSPQRKRAYFFNVDYRRKNQFDYWESMSVQKGKTGYFLLVEDKFQSAEKFSEQSIKYLKKLSPYFDSLKISKTYSLFHSNGITKKACVLIRGTNYNGLLPDSVEKY